jgi:hypothetical protein
MTAMMRTACTAMAITALVGTTAFAQTTGGAKQRAQTDTPPAPAQSSKKQASDQPGFAWAGYGSGHDSPYQAFNAVTPNGIPGSAGASGDRMTAVSECAAMSRKYSQTTWGNMELHQDRTCMARRGHME